MIKSDISHRFFIQLYERLRSLDSDVEASSGRFGETERFVVLLNEVEARLPLLRQQGQTLIRKLEDMQETHRAHWVREKLQMVEALGGQVATDCDSLRTRGEKLDAMKAAKERLEMVRNLKFRNETAMKERPERCQ